MKIEMGAVRFAADQKLNRVPHCTREDIAAHNDADVLQMAGFASE